MKKTLATKSYIHSGWNIQFDHPSEWMVSRTDGTADALSIHASRAENGWVPDMIIRLIDAKSKDVQQQLEALISEVNEEAEQVRVIQNQVKKLQDSSERGLLLFEHRLSQVPLLSQEVVIPIDGDKFLFCRATTEKSVWKKYKQQFAQIVTSLKFLEGDELEIIFTDDVRGSDKPRPLTSAVSNESVPAQPSVQEVHSPPEKSLLSFAEYCAQFEKYWRMCPVQDELLQVTADEQLAQALWGLFRGSHVLSWVEQEHAAFNGRSLRSMLQTSQGSVEVQDLLMQIEPDGANLAEIMGRAPVKRSFAPDDCVRGIDQLLQVDFEQRGEAWYRQVYQYVPGAVMYVPDMPVVMGPDNFPYFTLYTAPPSPHHQFRRLSLNELTEEVTNQGTGVVINPTIEYPVVLSYGGMWAYRVYEELVYPDQEVMQQSFDEPGGPVMTGKPTEDVFPLWARRVIRTVLTENVGIQHPAVFLETRMEGEPIPTLIFNVVEEDRSEEEIRAILDFLLWYLPPNYAIGGCRVDDETYPLLMEF